MNNYSNGNELQFKKKNTYFFFLSIFFFIKRKNETLTLVGRQSHRVLGVVRPPPAQWGVAQATLNELRRRLRPPQWMVGHPPFFFLKKIVFLFL
jgi:hypothetical protein